MARWVAAAAGQGWWTVRAIGNVDDSDESPWDVSASAEPRKPEGMRGCADGGYADTPGSQ
jgi:hypothetical protein